MLTNNLFKIEEKLQVPAFPVSSARIVKPWGPGKLLGSDSKECVRGKHDIPLAELDSEFGNLVKGRTIPANPRENVGGGGTTGDAELTGRAGEGAVEVFVAEEVGRDRSGGNPWPTSNDIRSTLTSNPVGMNEGLSHSLTKTLSSAQ